MKSQPRSVLIVEDQLLVALAMKADVERLGLRATIAASVEEANAILQRHTPALAIVDMNLREPFDGLQVARRLMALDAKIIICSAYERPRMDADDPPMKVEAWLRKPCSSARLEAAIHEALGGANSSRPTFSAGSE
jgi:two-component system response regulator RegA